MSTPKEIAAGLRGIALPESPTTTMNADLDAKAQEYMAAVEQMRAQAAGLLDPDSPKLADIHGACEAAKREIQTSIEAAKEAIDNLWTGVADVGVAIDRAAEALEII